MKMIKVEKSTVKTMGAVLLAGGVIGYIVENQLDSVRYPIRVEHAIISQCVNSIDRYPSERMLQKNIEICICSLEKATKDIGYKSDIDDELVESFNKHFSFCKIRR